MIKYQIVFIRALLLLLPLGGFTGLGEVDEDEPTGIERNIDYLIKAEDHPCILNNSSIDKIAIITLTSGRTINTSDISIILTDDKKQFIKTTIFEEGTWEVGEQITIQEIEPADAKPSYYKIYMLNQDKKPFSISFVNTDGAPKNEVFFFNRSEGERPLDMP